NDEGRTVDAALERSAGVVRGEPKLTGGIVGRVWFTRRDERVRCTGVDDPGRAGRSRIDVAGSIHRANEQRMGAVVQRRCRERRRASGERAAVEAALERGERLVRREREVTGGVGRRARLEEGNGRVRRG